MKLIVDAFGGDFAPESTLKGCVLAKNEYKNVNIILSGNEQLIKKAAEQLKIDISEFTILNAKDSISAEQNPAEILKEKNNSSMAVGLKALNLEDVDGFITAGSTGALAVGACYFVEKIKGVKRAALCPTLPSYKSKFLLIDAGANLECKENILLQFAIMGNIYAKNIFKIENPKVGLANVGIESKKGTLSHRLAYNLISNNKNINFIGNVEARYIPMGGCDVVVSDGLSGNMILKTMEGTAKCLIKSLKDIYLSTTKAKIAAALLKKEHKILKQKLDYKNYGGAIYLGFCKPIIKAHGNSNACTFKNAIKTAISCVNENIVYDIAKYIKS